MVKPLCHFCKYYERHKETLLKEGTCKAFPKDIPDIIIGYDPHTYFEKTFPDKYDFTDYPANTVAYGWDHRHPIVGDNGVQFQRASYKKIRENWFSSSTDAEIIAEFNRTTGELMIGRLWGWTLPKLVKNIPSTGIRQFGIPTPNRPQQKRAHSPKRALRYLFAWLKS